MTLHLTTLKNSYFFLPEFGVQFISAPWGTSNFAKKLKRYIKFVIHNFFFRKGQTLFESLWWFLQLTQWFGWKSGNFLVFIITSAFLHGILIIYWLSQTSTCFPTTQPCLQQTKQEVYMGKSWAGSWEQTECNEVSTHEPGQDSPIQSDKLNLVNKMFIIWETRVFLFNVTGLY